MSIRKKYNYVLTINLFLVLFFLILVICFFKAYNSGFFCKCEDKCETKEEIKTLNNRDYIGIFENIEKESECSKRTTLILSENFSFVFYVGDCNVDSYYHGKYKIENKEIILYEIKLQDTTIFEELKVNEEISFHILDSDTISSIFGRSDGIKLKRKLNVV